MATSKSSDTVFARLHKDGERVVCGHTYRGEYNCGGEIGLIRPWTAFLRPGVSPEALQDDPAATMPTIRRSRSCADREIFFKPRP